MDDLSCRFLDAFTAIEKHLRTLLDADRYMTFNEMVEKAAKSDKGRTASARTGKSMRR
jgi:hypothetical protein